MLGICRQQKNYRWLSVARVLPRYVFETVSFGYASIYAGKICRYPLYPWRMSLAGLGTCLVILLSFCYLDCDWISRVQKGRKC